MFPKPLSALKQENFVVDPVSNSAISLYASSTELTYPKLPHLYHQAKVCALKSPPCCFCLFHKNHGIYSFGCSATSCCFCLFHKNHGIYSFGCSATSPADFRESSVMFCKLLNIPSQFFCRPRWFGGWKC